MPLTLQCQKCGGDLPVPTDEESTLMRSGTIELVHAVCPGEKPPAPQGRYFEARVKIVEVAEEDGAVVATELASFVAASRAADLEAVMRPLAAELGVKWVEVEKHAKIADRGVQG